MAFSSKPIEKSTVPLLRGKMDISHRMRQHLSLYAAVGSGKAVRAGAVGRRAEALARGVTRVWVLVPRKLSPSKSWF